MSATSVSSFAGSRSAAFRANAGLSRRQPVARGATGAVMRKDGIHPDWHSDAKVFCNGVEVMTVGGTKAEYNVDIYSGNHPFYQGNSSVMVMDEGQLNKFKKRFAGLDALSNVATFSAGAGAADDDEPAAAALKAGGKGKGKGKKK